MQKAPKEAHIEQKAPGEAHIEQEALEEAHIEQDALEKAHVLENCEILVSCVHMGKKWDPNNIAINNIFSFQATHDIIRNYEAHKPRNVEKCRHRNDWPKWKAMQAKLNLLTKQEVFGPGLQTLEDAKSVG